jgi:Glycosyl hydrolases family 25
MTSPALVWAPVHTRPPNPTLPRQWIDVSNWQGQLLPEWFADWGGRGFGGLIVQAVTGTDGRSYTQQQLDMAMDCGWEVAAYVWCSPGDASDSAGIRSRLALLDPYAEELVFLALDLEQAGTTPEDVQADLSLCDQYLKKETVIYTARWFFQQQGWAYMSYWSDRRLWDAQYDNEADVDQGFVPYGGWAERWIKQYTKDPLDQNVMRV